MKLPKWLIIIMLIILLVFILPAIILTLVRFIINPHLESLMTARPSYVFGYLSVSLLALIFVIIGLAYLTKLLFQKQVPEVKKY